MGDIMENAIVVVIGKLLLPYIFAAVVVGVLVLSAAGGEVMIRILKMLPKEIRYLFYSFLAGPFLYAGLQLIMEEEILAGLVSMIISLIAGASCWYMEEYRVTRKY